jgi:hypothetical protein
MTETQRSSSVSAVPSAINPSLLGAEPAELVEAIAWRVVELLEARREVASTQLVDAATLASLLGISRSTVYEHADELGAVRLGDGSKPRLRFDPEHARAAVSCSASKRSQDSSPSEDGPSAAVAPRGRRRLPFRLPKPGSVLAIRDRQDAGSSEAATCP